MALWKGTFQQCRQTIPMHLDNFKIKEDHILGAGHDAFGLFNLQGKVSNNGQVCFVKKYEGKHSVTFEGRLSEDNNVISGSWKLNSASGAFRLRRQF